MSTVCVSSLVNDKCLFVLFFCHPPMASRFSQQNSSLYLQWNIIYNLIYFLSLLKELHLFHPGNFFHLLRIWKQNHWNFLGNELSSDPNHPVYAVASQVEEFSDSLESGALCCRTPIGWSDPQPSAQTWRRVPGGRKQTSYSTEQVNGELRPNQGKVEET